MSILSATNIEKKYGTDGQGLVVLSKLNISASKGEFIGIFGASGSGKSTLLHILGGLDKPNEGEVIVNDKNIYKIPNDKLASFRNKDVGFIFQFYHLLPEFNALENVMLPALIAGEKKKDTQERATESLKAVGLEDRVNHFPNELSGGEQQRVAISRALIMDPKIILADEPTGNLDQENGEKIMDMLLEINSKNGITILMVTHNPDLLKKLKKVSKLENGKLHQVS
jgi:lipoprotein-releasing system ATP-binding protein